MGVHRNEQPTSTEPAETRLLSVKNWPDRLFSADVIGNVIDCRLYSGSRGPTRRAVARGDRELVHLVSG